MDLRDIPVGMRMEIDCFFRSEHTRRIGVRFSAELPQTIYGAMKGEYDLPIYEHKDGLSVVPSCLDLSAVETELINEAGRELILAHLIKGQKEKFDYILIDCPPSLSLLTLNALTASDRLIIPVQAQFLAMRGLAELTALGVAAGADPKTFFGLAGVGDLIATCGSSLSRNYTFGANLGKGLTVEEATKVSNGVAEGVPTTDAVVALGDQLDVPTPLAYQMSRVLNEGISCSEMLAGLFGHEVTGE